MDGSNRPVGENIEAADFHAEGRLGVTSILNEQPRKGATCPATSDVLAARHPGTAIMLDLQEHCAVRPKLDPGREG